MIMITIFIADLS